MTTIDEILFFFNYDFVQNAFIVGTLIALCSSLLGVTLVLKRFSFIGDGLSHVAFGAMAIATILNIVTPLYFILPVTIASAILLLVLTQMTNVKGDAAIAMLSVGSLGIGYLVMNIFAKGPNLAGDVCSTLFGSTAILTLSDKDLYLSIALSLFIIFYFIFFYKKLFCITFDLNFAKSSGLNVDFYNISFAIIIAIIIVLGMNLVGSLLISALVVFPALTAMRLFSTYKSVTIASACISTLGATLGLLLSIIYSTPVGATIIAIDIFIFLLGALISLKIKA